MLSRKRKPRYTYKYNKVLGGVQLMRTIALGISCLLPILAYQNRAEYDEYFLKGIYSSPHIPTMQMLEKANTLQDILDNITDQIENVPDIEE